MCFYDIERILNNQLTWLHMLLTTQLFGISSKAGTRDTHAGKTHSALMVCTVQPGGYSVKSLVPVDIHRTQYGCDKLCFTLCPSPNSFRPPNNTAFSVNNKATGEVR